ncbi:uncharacterized protein TRIVIDRAFT_47121 [Trichoderma virens Gv29-8]|uniref:Protein kinase domain-containing protein n=1 Tax=Hypocrea virens (strain Gv29-8 / FGSC 10586) TaxID=413071 RepID=G9N0N4_HYPVG|nr:uncharacterized protein TRIVIDRAFT_47121 [Trichoderma virens Gv29-8]EHK19916.1 hypothetical protein TRIVIDRAFT_47121 [Trichoderma virens Gv29-8]
MSTSNTALANGSISSTDGNTFSTDGNTTNKNGNTFNTKDNIPNTNGNTSNTNGNIPNTSGNIPNTNGNTSNTNGNIPNTNGNTSNSLIKLLRDACVINPRDKKSFIPHRQLEKICNKQAVTHALATAFPEKDASFHEDCALEICHGKAPASSNGTRSCLKIFAILVLLKEVRLIKSFLDHPLCDNDLPLFSTDRFTELWSPREDPISPVKLPDEADHYAIIKGFIDQQWSVLAPRFSLPTDKTKRCEVYELHENHILPIEWISDRKFSGGFGLVEKVRIHSEHHNFKHKSFALKTMHLLRPEEIAIFFQQELDAFQNVTPGGHIIDICAAFKKGDSRGFLFPWAEGGSLKNLWSTSPRHIVEPARVGWYAFSRWICEQCHGIIRDLRKIHEPSDMFPSDDVESLFGIHSDIKPDNILYFSDDGLPLGTLKVSDLGLMKFHRQFSRTKFSASMGNAYQTYRAPEHDTSRMRSRKIDIWAFGCLFAEFITWAIGGNHAIELFKTNRINEDKDYPDPDETNGEWSEDNFFIIKRSLFPPYGKAKRKSSVKEWFKALIAYLGPEMAGTFFPEFLRFIQKWMLQPERNKRAQCSEVEMFLKKCLDNNQPDSSYWHFSGTVQGQNDASQGTTKIGTS